MKFITPRKNAVAAVESLRLGSISEIASNSAKIYRFNKEPIIVVHTETGQFKAFSARCTHLGCVVQYTTEGIPRFKCNCHQSEFDLNGNNIAGPAPLPLPPLRVTLQDSSIVVSKV